MYKLQCQIKFSVYLQHTSVLNVPNKHWIWSDFEAYTTFKEHTSVLNGFSGGSDGKASACNVGDSGSIPGLGRSPGEGNGNPLQYSCLENSMDWGAW